jgi:alpha-methylacyl-CoA racemase
VNSGPLHDVTGVELATIGPPSFASMLLGDLGADVIRIERPNAVSQFPGPARQELLHRNKRSVCLDLKEPLGLAAFHHVVGQADILADGFWPGVAERMGVGPEDCAAHKGFHGSSRSRLRTGGPA